MPRIYRYTGRLPGSRGRHRRPAGAYGFGGHHRHHRHRSPSPSPPRQGCRQPSRYTFDYGALFDLFHYGGGGRGGRGRNGGGSRDPDVSRIRLNDDKPKPDPKETDVLSVKDVDFRILENARKHRTDKFDATEGTDGLLVVRRGQPFDITINFTRPYDKQKDDLRLVFEIGKTPKPSKGTHVEFILSDKDEEDQWGAKIKSQSGNSLVVTVFTPSNLIVGEWSFKVDVVKRNENKTSIFRYNHEDPFYVLFNPWCEKDSVYMEREEDRSLYVLEDKGKIFAGSCKKISAKPWVFGQFEDKVLDCCMYLLDLSELSMAVRGNPIPVVRKLSAMVNSQDEGGVLTGNWSGDYSGGKSPLSWTGSAPILKQYFDNKSSVRFGQCWVFSGVLTTVCRALGIPARSVTNFASAHDVDASITIDLHYNEEGEPLEDLNEDSVWNFHVWNEVWMSRPDLPAGYGGWQAIDATPQELSDDVYCCGPSSVRAIKEGEVNLPFDGPFIFAEVNADKLYWQRQRDGSNAVVHVQKNSVGKFISTVSRNGEREDITGYYKHAEDSPAERVAVRRANQVGSSRRDCYQEGPKDVDFELKCDPDQFVGSDFEVALHCTNGSRETRTLFGHLSTSTMYYTGVVAEALCKMPVNITLKPGESKALIMCVPFDDYNKKLKDCCMLSLSAMVSVTETKQVFSSRDDARLRKPHLSIKAPAHGNVEKEFELQISFTNTMPCTLTDCSLDVEGPGITTAKKYPQSICNVSASGTFMTSVKVTPTKVGDRHIVIIFNARELEDVNGTHDITIKA